MDDVIVEFNKLRETSSDRDYQEHFKALRPLVLAKKPVLVEEYFISSLVSGLRDEIKYMVRMLHRENVDQALNLAHLREAFFDVTAERACRVCNLSS